MPFVRAQVVEGRLSESRRKALIDGLMDIVVKTMGRSADSTVIILDEIPAARWFIAGIPLSENGAGRGAAAAVQIHVSRGTCRPEEMEAVVEAGKSLVTKVMGSWEASNYFIIQELNPDAWGIDGSTMTAKRRASG
jgi:4-oxalocrotonate tautomerase